MDTVKVEEELTSTVGNVLSTSKEEKNDSSDATPTSSTDANTNPMASQTVSDDPISSTSSDTFDQGKGTEMNQATIDETDRLRSDKHVEDLLGIPVATGKITENVEDLVHDLESLLGETPESFKLSTKDSKIDTARSSTLNIDHEICDNKAEKVDSFEVDIAVILPKSEEILADNSIEDLNLKLVAKLTSIENKGIVLNNPKNESTSGSKTIVEQQESSQIATSFEPEIATSLEPEIETSNPEIENFSNPEIEEDRDSVGSWEFVDASQVPDPETIVSSTPGPSGEPVTAPVPQNTVDDITSSGDNAPPLINPENEGNSEAEIVSTVTINEDLSSIIQEPIRDQLSEINVSEAVSIKEVETESQHSEDQEAKSQDVEIVTEISSSEGIIPEVHREQNSNQDELLVDIQPEQNRCELFDERESQINDLTDQKDIPKSSDISQEKEKPNLDQHSNVFLEGAALETKTEDTDKKIEEIKSNDNTDTIEEVKADISEIENNDKKIEEIKSKDNTDTKEEVKADISEIENNDKKIEEIQSKDNTDTKEEVKADISEIENNDKKIEEIKSKDNTDTIEEVKADISEIEKISTEVIVLEKVSVRNDNDCEISKQMQDEVMKPSIKESRVMKHEDVKLSESKENINNISLDDEKSEQLDVIFEEQPVEVNKTTESEAGEAKQLKLNQQECRMTYITKPADTQDISEPTSGKESQIVADECSTFLQENEGEPHPDLNKKETQVEEVIVTESKEEHKATDEVEPQTIPEITADCSIPHSQSKEVEQLESSTVENSKTVQPNIVEIRKQTTNDSLDTSPLDLLELRENEVETKTPNAVEIKDLQQKNDILEPTVQEREIVTNDCPDYLKMKSQLESVNTRECADLQQTLELPDLASKNDELTARFEQTETIDIKIDENKDIEESSSGIPQELVSNKEAVLITEVVTEIKIDVNTADKTVTESDLTFQTSSENINKIDTQLNLLTEIKATDIEPTEEVTESNKNDIEIQNATEDAEHSNEIIEEAQKEICVLESSFETTSKKDDSKQLEVKVTEDIYVESIAEESHNQETVEVIVNKATSEEVDVKKVSHLVELEFAPLQLSEDDSDDSEPVPRLALEPDEDSNSKQNEAIEEIVEQQQEEKPIYIQNLVSSVVDTPENLETILAVASLQSIDIPQNNEREHVVSEKERREMEALAIAVQSITDNTSNSYMDDYIETTEPIVEVPIQDEPLVVPEIEQEVESQLSEPQSEVVKLAEEPEKQIIKPQPCSSDESIDRTGVNSDAQIVVVESKSEVSGFIEVESKETETVTKVEKLITNISESSELTYEITEPTHENTEPTHEITEPTQEIIEPNHEIVEPTYEITEPTHEITEPTDEITEPINEITESVFQGIKPVLENREPEACVSEPAIKDQGPQTIKSKPAHQIIECKSKSMKSTSCSEDPNPQKDISESINSMELQIKPSVDDNAINNTSATEIVTANIPNDKLVVEENSVVDTSTEKVATTDSKIETIDSKIETMDSKIESVEQAQLVKVPDTQEKTDDAPKTRSRSSDKGKKHKKDKYEELTINVDVPDREKTYSPKITIKPIKVPDEEVSTTTCTDSEITKGSLKMTITKQSDNTHSILKINDQQEDSETLIEREEQPIPKLIIKPKMQQLEQQHSPKMSTRSSKHSPTASNQRSGSPRINIKPVVKTDKQEPVSPLKIKLNPKTNTKSTKEEELVIKKGHVKPVAKIVEETESAQSPKITIKIPKPDHEKEVNPKLTIKPIKKPEDDIENEEKERSSPKITIKPIIKPQEPESNSPDAEEEEEEVKERIVLKINKGNLPSPAKESKKREHSVEDDKSEKLAKITVKISKEGGHPHIVHQQGEETTSKRPHEEFSAAVEKTKKQKVEVESIISTRSRHKEQLDANDKSNTLLETRTKHKDYCHESPVESKRSRKDHLSDKSKLKDIDNLDDIQIVESKLDSPIVISEDSRSQDSSSIILLDDSYKEDSVSSLDRVKSPDSSKSISKYVVPGRDSSIPSPGPKKRGRPRKMVLEVREEIRHPEEISKVKETEGPLQPVHESGRPKRSCRGQSVCDTLGIKPRKPRGGGRGRGSRRGIGNRASSERDPLSVSYNSGEEEDNKSIEGEGTNKLINKEVLICLEAQEKVEALPTVTKQQKPVQVDPEIIEIDSDDSESEKDPKNFNEISKKGLDNPSFFKTDAQQNTKKKPETSVQLMDIDIDNEQNLQNFITSKADEIQDPLSDSIELDQDESTVEDKRNILKKILGGKIHGNKKSLPDEERSTPFAILAPPATPKDFSGLDTSMTLTSTQIVDSSHRKSLNSEISSVSSTSVPVEVMIVDEDTRMSADTSSRAQTPAKQVVTSSEMVEESQSSIHSTTTTESGKTPSRPSKAPRLEVQENDSQIITADLLTEYYWNGNGPFMLQEQVAQFLGIKSFKRKYPGIMRRMLDMQERDFIREKGLASENMCDLGLTAVNSADILDIMYSDFQEKYEEYCKHQRDRQAKEMISKQKALSLSVSQDKSKADITDQAIQSAAQWNTKFNKERREQRKAYMDLQNLNVHYPKGKKVPPLTNCRPGNYPVALVPGQFVDYYKEFTPTELNNLPINTICYDEVNFIPREISSDSSSDGSDTDSDTSGSSTDSSSDSDSSSGIDDCKLCKHSPKKFSPASPIATAVAK